MKEGVSSPKIIAGVTTTLFFVALAFLLMQYNTNGELVSNLNTEKLKSESLLSEKLQLEKDMAKLKTQIGSLQGTNAELDKALASAQSRLSASEAEYKKLQGDNASLKHIRKQYSELQAIRKELDRNIATLNITIADLQREKNELNSKVAMLEQRNKILADDLHKAQLAYMDYSQIDAVKRNDKLTVNARKAKKIQVTFDVPSSLKDISFRILDPKGNALSATHGTIASRVVSTGDVVTASADKYSAGPDNFKRMEMTYLTNKKMGSGIYKVEVLSENLYVASLQVRLK